MIKKSLLLCMIACSFINAASLKEQYPYSKVIIWGHKLKTHTHSWIHWAFNRTFTHLGYETYWLDNKDSVEELDLSNALFITEGQVDQKIPIRDDCYYILHNCTSSKYHELLRTGHAINLQVFTYDVLKRNVFEVQKYIYIDIPEKIIYMPWATDLLPEEIEDNKRYAASCIKQRYAYWVGTIGGGEFGNIQEISAFTRACKRENIPFTREVSVSMERNMRHTCEALIAPAIVGTWQQKQGYIPCRIFKNISYGQMGVTNSPAVYELFEEKIVYNPDAFQLFHDAKKRIETMHIDELLELMDFVKENHTYINRIEHLLSFLSIVKARGV